MKYVLIEIFSFIQNSPAQATIYITLFSLIISGFYQVFTSIIMPLFNLLFNKLFYKKKIEARESISRIVRNKCSNIKDEPLFIDNKTKNYFFCRNTPIKNFSTKKKINTSNLYHKSYLLIGEAGCGKSSVLKKDFLHYQFLNLVPYRNKIAIFLDSDTINYYFLDENNFNKFLENLAAAKYKYIYLFIDGIDELGQTNYQIFNSCLKKIVDSVKIKKLKISARTEFLNKIQKTTIYNKAKKQYIVDGWTCEKLEKIAQKITHLHVLKNQKNDLDKALKKLKEQKNQWCPYINSPLLLKMYFYILIYGNNEEDINFNNRFDFYQKFISIIITVHAEKEDHKFLSQKIIEETLKDYSNLAFIAFKDNQKAIDCPEVLLPILKKSEANSDNNKVQFTHETFFEFLVGYNYIEQLLSSNFDTTVINVIAQNYSNNFADFISDSIKLRSDYDKVQITNKLLRIYKSTLSKQIEFPFSENLPKIEKELSDYIEELPINTFFSLKYEIIFRLGRIGLHINDINEALKNIYYLDKNTKMDDIFFEVVIKRCCAISASFLGYEEIEFDYIDKMLPYNDSYNEIYDLVNRSHTLVFYGDVDNCNIMYFRDTNEKTPFQKAFGKRMDRISTVLPFETLNMSSAEKRKYLFRVFDLATIYTFMYNRKYKLTEKEKESISKCLVQFEGATDKRNNLMKNIKQKILELQKDFENAK